MVDALHEKVKAEQEARMQRAIDNLEVHYVKYILAADVVILDVISTLLLLKKTFPSHAQTPSQ